MRGVGGESVRLYPSPRWGCLAGRRFLGRGAVCRFDGEAFERSRRDDAGGDALSHKQAYLNESFDVETKAGFVMQGELVRPR